MTNIQPKVSNTDPGSQKQPVMEPISQPSGQPGDSKSQGEHKVQQNSDTQKAGIKTPKQA